MRISTPVQGSLKASVPHFHLRLGRSNRSPTEAADRERSDGAKVTPQPGPSRHRARARPNLRLWRRALRSMGFKRWLRGGRLADLGRLPRYGLFFAVGAAILWAPIILYIVAAPKHYTSAVTLILPGQGVSSSVNLSEIGQASESATSAYASSSLSPSVTYKNLIESDDLIEAAAKLAKGDPHKFGRPLVKLVDETNLIHVELTGNNPAQAQQNALAMLAAFQQELDRLRDDDIMQRDVSAAKTIAAYQASVEAIRAKINALELVSGLTSPEQYASIVAATETLQNQAAATAAALDLKEGTVRTLSNLLKVTPQMAALTLKLQADEETAALTEAVSKAAANTSQMEQQFGPQHPKYRDALAQENGIRARLVARGVAISGLPAVMVHGEVESSSKGERPPLLSRLVLEMMDRQGLAAQLAAESAELAARRGRVRGLVEINSKLDGLNRDYKIADAVFSSALARLDTSKADIFASYPMVQVVEPATLPKSPSSPNVMIAAVAGVAGTMMLLISLGMTWVRRAVIDTIVARAGRKDETAGA